GGLDPLPHRLLAAQHVGGAVALRDRDGGDVVGGRAALDGVEEVLHGRNLPTGHRAGRTCARAPRHAAQGFRWAAHRACAAGDVGDLPLGAGAVPVTAALSLTTAGLPAE